MPIVLLALALSVALSQSSPSSPCVLYVSTVGNVTTRGCRQRDTPCAQLRWALEEAEQQSGCVIELRGDIEGAGNGALVLKAALGAVELACKDDATLRGGTSFIQLEPHATLSVRDCLVTGFASSVFVLQTGSSLTLLDSRLHDNRGGVVSASRESRLTVTRCALANNTNDIGGSIAAEGALVFVSDSTFKAGRALHGGHIALQSGARAEISNSQFLE